MTFFGLLPIIALLLLIRVNLRDSFVRAVAYGFVQWGTLVWLITEVSSAFQGLTATLVGIAWLAISLSLLATSFYLTKPEFSWKKTFAEFDVLSWSVLGIVSVFALTTLVIAVVAPPNTWDSMTYHMPRVMHWEQNQTVGHYHTNIPRQLYFAPMAEYTIMNFTILSGKDRWANLPQWIAGIVSLIMTVGIVRQLTDSREVCALSVLTVSTIPLFVLQASSTQNDLFATAWLTTTVYLALCSMKNNVDWLQCLMLGLAFGLGVLSKQTAAFFGVGFMVWFGTWHLARMKPMNILKVAVAAVVSIAVYVPHAYRSYESSGSITGLLTKKEIVESPGIGTVMINFCRNVAMHFTLPAGGNELIEQSIVQLETSAGLDPKKNGATRYDFMVNEFSRHEDSAGAPLHILLMSLAAIGAIVLVVRQKLNWQIALFGLMLLVGAGVFITVLKWDPWRQRLHLPWLVIAVPYSLTVFNHFFKSIPRIALYGTGLLFVVTAIPALLWNESRPIIPITTTVETGDPAQPEVDFTVSIFHLPRDQQYFMNARTTAESFERLAGGLKDFKVKTLEIVVGPDDWEYPLWPLLKAVKPELQIVHFKDEKSSLQLESPVVRLYMARRQRVLEFQKPKGIAVPLGYMTIILPAEIPE